MVSKRDPLSCGCNLLRPRGFSCVCVSQMQNGPAVGRLETCRQRKKIHRGNGMEDRDKVKASLRNWNSYRLGVEAFGGRQRKTPKSVRETEGRQGSTFRIFIEPPLSPMRVYSTRLHIDNRAFLFLSLYTSSMKCQPRQVRRRKEGRRRRGREGAARFFTFCVA